MDGLFETKMSGKKLFGIAIEHKDEPTTFMETKLMSYDDASNLLEKFLAKERVIRGCVFLAKAAGGNGSIFSGE